MAPPRVLLFTGEPPHTSAAGAIVLHRLLSDYPTDRLLVVTNHPPPPDAGRLECRYERVPLPADRLSRTRLWPWRNTLRVLGLSALSSLRPIDAALAGFQPDLVVTLMQDSWYYDYAARYARARRQPLVLIVHDLPDGFEPVPSWLRARQQRRDAAVYRQAVRRLCISEPMRDHFREVVGEEGEVLPPPRADDPPAQAPETCAQLKQPGRLVLGYAGGLHYGYGEQLLRLLPVLRETGTRLECHCPKPAGMVSALAEATDVITFHGHAPTPEAAWQGILARCDAVLQPYLDPPGKHAQQYRTHFPSKLGDALSLGLPLIITGPRDASGVAWCAAQGACAWHVDNTSSATLTAALLRLRDDPALRIELAMRAQVAATRLDAAALREQFYAHLQCTALMQHA